MTEATTTITLHEAMKNARRERAAAFRTILRGLFGTKPAEVHAHGAQAC